MTKRIEPTPQIEPELLKTMKKYHFTAVVFINRDISVRVVGSVESWHRSIGDAKRFASTLNKIYGTKDGYKGVSV